MSDNDSPSNDFQPSATSEASSELELKPDIVNATAGHESAASIVAEIAQCHSRATTEVEQIERVRREAEAALAALQKEALALKGIHDSVQQQLADAQAVANELTRLSEVQRNEQQRTTEAAIAATESLNTVRTLTSSVGATVSGIEGLKTQVEQAAQVAETRSSHIEDGRKYVDAKRAELDTIVAATQLLATNAETHFKQAQAAAQDLSTVVEGSRQIKMQLEHDAALVAANNTKCAEAAASTQSLADKAARLEQTLADYQSHLVALELTANERLKTIESLLPGATAAGLSSAFSKRREVFTRPLRIWQGLFFGSIGALLCLAVAEFGLFSETQKSLVWEQLGMSMLHRLPFAAPLIWLALYASRQAALAQRVEEDYAFKEVVSRSFEGFRREMTELEGKSAPGSALTRLCNGVLGVITSPPGRIYERHALTTTPLSAITDATPAGASQRSRE
jgi:hypothetical protein